MVPNGNKAKPLLLVNHTTKTIHLQMNNFVNSKGDTKLLLQIVFYRGLYEFYFIYFLFELTDFFRIQY